MNFTNMSWSRTMYWQASRYFGMTSSTPARWISSLGDLAEAPELVLFLVRQHRAHRLAGERDDLDQAGAAIAFPCNRAESDLVGVGDR